MSPELKYQLGLFNEHWRVFLSNDNVVLVKELVEMGLLDVRKPAGNTPRMYRQRTETNKPDLPEGYVFIEDWIADLEKDPDRAEALNEARLRLANKPGRSMSANKALLHQLESFGKHWRVLLAKDDQMLANKLVDMGLIRVKKSKGRTPRMYKFGYEPGTLLIYLSIIKPWDLNEDQVTGLLGEDVSGNLSEEAQRRVFKLYDISKSLRALHSGELVNKWILMPNTNDIFAGKTPCQYLADGGLPEFELVQRLLKARLAGN